MGSRPTLRIWNRLHAHLLTLLRKAEALELETVVVDSVSVRAFGGGENTGPKPVNRRKPDITHTVMVDRRGVPLAIRTAGANASDQRQIIPVMVDFPKIQGRPGRPKESPDELYTDRGYGSDDTRAWRGWLGIGLQIARRRTEHGSGRSTGSRA